MSRNRSAPHHDGAGRLTYTELGTRADARDAISQLLHLLHLQRLQTSRSQVRVAEQADSFLVDDPVGVAELVLALAGDVDHAMHDPSEAMPALLVRGKHRP